MKKFLKIFLIFLYFSLCFIFKGNIEAHLAQNNIQYYKSINSSIEHINFQDSSALVQANNQEITNFQNNSNNNNSLDKFKKYNLLKIDYTFKENQRLSFNADFIAFNFKHIIYTRAP